MDNVLPRLMVAAPSSSTGKTTVTCALLHVLSQRGLFPVACKCGPDYIDPMFHRRVLGVPSHNLDLFFNDPQDAGRLAVSYGREGGILIFEGVMGLYDGVGGITDQASSWQVADATSTPVLLVLQPKGSSLTLAAQVKGLLAFRPDSHIKAILLNNCSEKLHAQLAPMLTRETGLPVVGYLPPMPEAAIPSRHLGLFTAEEVEDFHQRISVVAEMFSTCVDIELLLQIADEVPSLATSDSANPLGNPTVESSIESSVKGEVVSPKTPQRFPQEPPQVKSTATVVRIGIAQDEAFCFYYEGTLELFRSLGAELVPFSPIHDQNLPVDIQGLYIGGGYPELHAAALAENVQMRTEMRQAIENGLPTIAECGGFLYLQESLQDEQGVQYPMVGILSGTGYPTGRLRRFGYVTLTATKDSLLFHTGDTVKGHEFHYWDVSDTGFDLLAEKPISGVTWKCCVTTGNLYAGFPHLALEGEPMVAKRFIEACHGAR